MIRMKQLNHDIFVNPWRQPVALVALALVMPAGLLVALVPGSGLMLIGVICVLGYALLIAARPFAAFVMMVFLALSAWASTINVAPGVSIMIGVGLIFAAGWLVRLALRSDVFVNVKEYVWLVGLAVVIIISALLNQGKWVGFAPVFTYLQLLLLVLLVVNLTTTPLRLHTLSIVIVTSSGILALLILLNQFDLLPPVLTLHQTSNVLVAQGYTTITRSQGLWGGPNLTAIQLTVAIPFLIEWWPAARGKRQRLLLIGAATLIIAAVLFTYSIGGMIGLSTVFLTRAIIDLRHDMPSKILRVIFFLALVILVLFAALPDLYQQRFSAQLMVFFDAVRNSDWDRLLLIATNRGDCWQAAVRSIADAPLLGHGPGSVMFANAQYSFLYIGLPLAAHNIFLSIGSELGLIGLALFSGLLISTIVMLYRAWRLQPDHSFLQQTGKAILIALIAFAVQSLALDSQNLKLLWILLGMAIACRELTTRSTVRQLEAAR